MHKPFKLSTLVAVIDDINNRRKQVGYQRFLPTSFRGIGSSIFAGKKILVVDDAVSILKFMSQTLKIKAEAIVTQAKDGQQAVEECEKQNFDLILTDIQMPVLDGFGEARRIRAMEQERGLARTIIVGISANTQVT